MAKARSGRRRRPTKSNWRKPTPACRRLEQQGDAAQSIIPADVQSVCLLHVAVAFNDQQTGKRLRYGGLNQDGEPLQDSDGNPILTLDGNGPEVKLDVFGTGFLAGPDGTVITNRHVAEPWWKNDDISSIDEPGIAAADFRRSAPISRATRARSTPKFSKFRKKPIWRRCAWICKG